MRIKSFIKKISKNMDLEVYPDALIVINALNSIVDRNRKFENIFGYTESEIIGRNIAILFNDDVEKIHISLSSKKSQILTAKNRNGEDIIVEIACNDLKNAGKTIISVKDITKSQKVIEKLLLEYEKVSKIAQHKSGFLAAHSNDLKNPIQSIISFAQGMSDGVCGQLNEKQEKYASIIHKNAVSLLTLTDNMIILSKIEADQVQTDYKVFDVIELVESVKNDISHLLEEKNISFEINYSALERRNIYSDEGILRQILINLYTNAVKFTDAGKIEINLIHPDPETVKNVGIQSVPYFTEKSYILFSVSDTGIGISDEDKLKIFDEYNSDKSMTKKFGGTGLGLAITKKLTAVLGGNIWVNSKMSNGSKFMFIIPAERIVTPLITKTEA